MNATTVIPDVDDAATDASIVASLAGVLDDLIYDICFEGMEKNSAKQLEQAQALARILQEKTKALSSLVDKLPRIR